MALAALVGTASTAQAVTVSPSGHPGAVGWPSTVANNPMCGFPSITFPARTVDRDPDYAGTQTISFAYAVYQPGATGWVLAKPAALGHASVAPGSALRISSWTETGLLPSTVYTVEIVYKWTTPSGGLLATESGYPSRMADYSATGAPGSVNLYNLSGVEVVEMATTC